MTAREQRGELALIEPPDTELLTWGALMGPHEVDAFERIAKALEDAIASGALRPASSGWKTAAQGLSDNVLLGPAPGAPNRTFLSTVVEERVETWIDFAGPAELRDMRQSIAGEVVEVHTPSDTDVEPVLRPLRWLLDACRDGVTLTQAGYLPTTLVREALATFDWWPEYLSSPRSEFDFLNLMVVREVATRLRLLTKRGRRLTTARRAVRLLDEPIPFWRTVVPAIGSSTQFDAMLSELISHLLLRGPMPGEELVDRISQIIERQGWRTGRSPVVVEEVRFAVFEPLREWRLFGLLDEQQVSYRPGAEQPWIVALSAAGKAAALYQLHVRATGPRDDLQV